jgi:DNA modification methylase
MLSDERDLVCDFLAGSNKLGKVCEALNRRWITSEKSLTYVSGSKFHVPGYRNVAADICAL